MPNTLGLEPVMRYLVRTTHPLEPTAGAPGDPTQYWQLSEATLDGERIHATLAATGGDWMRMRSDGFWRPDVRVQFVTDDAAVVLMHYVGLVEQTAAFKQAAEENRPTDWSEQ